MTGDEKDGPGGSRAPGGSKGLRIDALVVAIAVIAIGVMSLNVIVIVVGAVATAGVIYWMLRARALRKIADAGGRGRRRRET